MNKILIDELNEVIESITKDYEKTKKEVLKSMFMKYILNAKNVKEQELIINIIKNISWYWDVVIDEYISDTIVELFDEESIVINHLGYDFKKKEICVEKVSSSPSKIYASLAKDGCIDDASIIKLVDIKDLDNIKTIFLVDDFIGSGSQIINVLEYLEEKGIKEKNIYIVAYVCHEFGKDNINEFTKKSNNNISLKYKILESNYKNKLFDKDLKQYIDSICVRCGNPSFKFGFKECGSMISMNGISPNNNLSLLWSDDIKNWNKLLDRNINITILANKKNNYINKHKSIIYDFYYNDEIKKVLEYEEFYLLVLTYNCYGMDIESLMNFNYFATIDMCEQKIQKLQDDNFLAKSIFLEIIDSRILSTLKRLDKKINREITNSLKNKNTKFY